MLRSVDLSARCHACNARLQSDETECQACGQERSDTTWGWLCAQLALAFLIVWTLCLILR